jgi:hypothetical protein
MGTAQNSKSIFRENLGKLMNNNELEKHDALVRLARNGVVGLRDTIDHGSDFKRAAFERFLKVCAKRHPKLPLHDVNGAKSRSPVHRSPRRFG